MSRHLFVPLLLACATAFAQTVPEAPHSTPAPASAARTARQRARDSVVVLDCVPMTRELQEFSTGTIATAMSNCVEQARYGDAARLFLLATIDARFDAAKVGEPDKEDAAQVLERQLQEMHTPADMAALARARRELLADAAPRRALCAQIRHFGPPNDASTYRDSPRPASGTARSFDADRTWATLVQDALDCHAR